MALGRFRWRQGWTVRRGMLLCGTVVCLSVALALLLPAAFTLCLLVLLLSALLLMLLVPRLRYAVPVFCAVVAILSLLRGVAYTVLQVPPTAELAGTEDTVTGQVIGCPSSGQMYTLRVTQAQHLSAGAKLLLYCNDRVAPRLHETVTASVEYKTLYDSQRYHMADGIYLQAYPTVFGDDAITVSSGRKLSAWTMWLRPVREYLAEQITQMLRGDEGALVVAMCYGDKSGLSYAVSDAFRACGLPHLLAVSGLHLTVVAGSLQTALQRLRLRRTAVGILTLLTLLLYMWMIEFTPSVTRSGIMYGIVLLGLLFRRRSDGLNSLGLALTVILLATPNAIYDLGFWLSFGATAGILCFYPRLRQWLSAITAFAPDAARKPLGWITDSLAVTAAATLPLLPIMAFAFRELSLVAPLANLLTVLPAGWMLVLGFLAALLRSSFVFAWLGDALLLAAGLIAKYLIAVSEWLGSFVGATMLLQQAWQFFWLSGACVALAVALYRFRARTVRCVWCGLLAIFLLAHGTGALLSNGATQVDILSADDSAVIVLHHEGESVVLSRQLSGLYTARRAMESDGYRYPQLLIVGEGETPDAAYMTEWLTTYPATGVITAGTACAIAPDAPYLSEGSSVRFWDDHSLQVLEDDWWLLSMGSTTLLIAPEGSSKIPKGVSADGVLLYAEALPDTAAISTSAVFCILSEKVTAEVAADGTLHTVTEEISCRMITGGNGDWRKLLF